MDDWVLRAMQRWPNVPALFGWLGLDRRGRWLIKGEVITHPLIVRAISRNYACDEHGRWYFQNGPQRGYIELASTPFVLRFDNSGLKLVTNNELEVSQPKNAYLDAEGAVYIDTEHGFGEVLSSELSLLLERMYTGDRAMTEDDLAQALGLSSGEDTSLLIDLYGSPIPIQRLDWDQMPGRLGFVRNPRPREGERTSTGAPD